MNGVFSYHSRREPVKSNEKLSIPPWTKKRLWFLPFPWLSLAHGSTDIARSEKSLYNVLKKRIASCFVFSSLKRKWLFNLFQRGTISTQSFYLQTLVHHLVNVRNRQSHHSSRTSDVQVCDHPEALSDLMPSCWSQGIVDTYCPSSSIAPSTIRKVSIFMCWVAFDLVSRSPLQIAKVPKRSGGNDAFVSAIITSCRDKAIKTFLSMIDMSYAPKFLFVVGQWIHSAYSTRAMDMLRQCRSLTKLTDETNTIAVMATPIFTSFRWQRKVKSRDNCDQVADIDRCSKEKSGFDIEHLNRRLCFKSY